MELREREDCLASLAEWFANVSRTGGCDALFTPRPLAPVLDIARDAEGPLADAVRRKADRDELFAATLDELERQPALVGFEDLHWADEATLDIVKYLGRRVGRTRTLPDTTRRPVVCTLSPGMPGDIRRAA